MSPDHEGGRIIPSPGSFLPSALSNSPVSPHQAPCIHRHIQEGEKNKHSPEPTARSRNCRTKTKQPPWHTAHSCCCTQNRRKWHFIKCVYDATHHNMKHDQLLQTCPILICWKLNSQWGKIPYVLINEPVVDCCDLYLVLFVWILVL